MTIPSYGAYPVGSVRRIRSRAGPRAPENAHAAIALAAGDEAPSAARISTSRPCGSSFRRRTRPTVRQLSFARAAAMGIWPLATRGRMWPNGSIRKVSRPSCCVIGWLQNTDTPLRCSMCSEHCAPRRAGAEYWRINPAKIGVMGFSAGGHLASTAGTHFDSGQADAADPIDRVSCRPDFMILCYPVVALATPYAHAGSKKNLLGPILIPRWSKNSRTNARSPANTTHVLVPHRWR